MKISIEERTLHFKQPAGTSRGVYTERRIWLVTMSDGEAVGRGECAPLPDLSCDALPPYIYNNVLRRFCDEVEQTGEIPYKALRPYPSMLFGLETALLSLRAPLSSSVCTLFDTPFSRGEVGIPINGLVWMGTFEEMSRRIEEKLEQGFRCIKLKIGAIDFRQELTLIQKIRQRFSHHEVELRVDANGAFPFQPDGPSSDGGFPAFTKSASADGGFPAFTGSASVDGGFPAFTGSASVDGGFPAIASTPPSALYRLELLSQYNIHSIEQPIRQGQWANMAELCRESPLPIALDEELIGINDPEQKRQLLHIIKPAYIVLKPSLHGGMAGCREWISLARDEGIGSWITSALESNIGLNAIAQFCSSVYGDAITMPQGLGTGQLFTDNFPSALEIKGDQLWISKHS